MDKTYTFNKKNILADEHENLSVEIINLEAEMARQEIVLDGLYKKRAEVLKKYLAAAD